MSTGNDCLLWATHITGLLALGLNIYGLASADDRNLRTVAVWASLLMCVHNLLIGAATAAALHTLLILRTLCSTRLVGASKRTQQWACAGFLGATIAFGGATYSGEVSALLVAGSCCVTVAFFFARGAPLRAVIGANCLVWLVNAAEYGSAWQFVSGLLGASSAAIGTWKILRAKNQ